MDFFALWNEKETRSFAGVVRTYRVARTSRATERWERKLSGDPHWGGTDKGPTEALGLSPGFMLIYVVGRGYPQSWLCGICTLAQ